MKLLATGDWQLGLGGPARLIDQEAVAEQIVDIAIERGVELVLHGGDVFEGPRVDPEELRAFRRPLARLRAQGIPVLVASGNGRHDQSMRAAKGLEIFQDIPGVTVALRPGAYRFDGCTVGALPWVDVGNLVAAQGGGDRDDINQHAAELLVNVARGLLAECRALASDLPAILLPHWSLSGASLPTGLTADAMRAPIIDSYALLGLGFEAILAAHIHRPQFFGGLGWTEPNAAGELFTEWPAMLYVGSPSTLDHGEENHAHGVWIVDLAHSPQLPQAVNGGGEPASPVTCEFVPVSGRPFVTLDVEPGDGDHGILWPEMWVDALQEAVVRVRYRATRAEQRRIDTAEIRRAILAAGAVSVKVEPEYVREDRVRVDGVHEDLAPLDAYDLYAAANDLEPELALRARVRLAQHLEAVGS